LSEFAELEDVATYIFTWHSMIDSYSCAKCVALNGREYREQDLFAPVLVDPEFGPIWDLNADHSLAHGRTKYNCRCQLTVRVEFDWSKWEVLQEIQETMRLVKA